MSLFYYTANYLAERFHANESHRSASLTSLVTHQSFYGG